MKKRITSALNKTDSEPRPEKRATLGHDTQPERFFAHNLYAQGSLSATQYDRDQILYCDFFARLAEVSQVVSPAYGFQVQNRLTHSLKVAQFGRRAAERLLIMQPQSAKGSGSSLDVDAVEAAGLAHDLGHPPFGHIAEEELNKLSRQQASIMHVDFEGFEGNAQTFRIVTRLASGEADEHAGLNLTRKTLNSILKYPWLKGEEGIKLRKWGAYKSDESVFAWARAASTSEDRTLEAEIMDWADDVTYATHDAFDFYRAGKIPLHLLGSQGRETYKFFDEVFARMKAWQVRRAQLEEKFVNLLSVTAPFSEAYSGSNQQDTAVRQAEKFLRNRYLLATELSADGSKICVNSELKDEVSLLKQLTWHYVILGPELANEQEGQRNAIRTVFTALHESTHPNRQPYLFPPKYRNQLKEVQDHHPAETLRIVVDYVASMSEAQLWRAHGILTGRTNAWNQLG